MTVAKFNYIAPKTLKEAINILCNEGEYATVMAGGTDLLVKIKRNLLFPKLIVGLKNIASLDQVHLDNKKGLIIGATALLSTIAENKKIITNYPTIALAAESTANTQIRNMGTVIGNLCNASPSADNAPTLLAMGAILHITGPYGNKKIELENFFKGPGLTALNPGEIVTSAFIPKPSGNYGTAYCTLSQRGKIDCSAVGVGTMVKVINNKFEDVRIFVSACGPTPTRAIKAEKVLIDHKITPHIIHKASLEASKEMNPISDIRASAKYRTKMISIVTKRALNDAKQMSNRQIK